MNRKSVIYAVLAALLMALQLVAQMERSRPAGARPATNVARFRNSWQVLEPVTRGNLSIYPVVSTLKVDASDFLTLDEGIASGAVQITERGSLQGTLHRRRPESEWPHPVELGFNAGASVNELVLVNNSPKYLILLAGEVVSGGKQNRIIGADVVVPPRSEPVPLTVFCVEHGRWSAGGGGFNAAQAMAHPGIRKEAQAHRSQQGVWDSVARSVAKMEAAAPTESYLDALASPKAKRAEGLAASLQADCERELQKRLQGRHAVGVIVAVGGEFIWSDVFPSEDLFLKYWPKLLRSYVLEADPGVGKEMKNVPSTKQALAYLLDDVGRISIRTEPGAYRRTEISAEAHRIVALEALAKGETGGLLAHFNKMSLT